MKHGAWPAPIWITEIGRAQQTGENNTTYEAAQTSQLGHYITAINAHRQAGLPITTICWDRLREANTGDGGLYKLDGTARPVLAALTTTLTSAWAL